MFVVMGSHFQVFRQTRRFASVGDHDPPFARVFAGANDVTAKVAAFFDNEIA